MLELTGVNAFYGQAHILHDISLSLGRGERVAVLGRNGAGKSTLLKSIMNAGPAVRGEVRLDGKALGNTSASDRVRLGMSLVPEDRRIFTHITVAENIRLAQHGTERRDALPTLAEVHLASRAGANAFFIGAERDRNVFDGVGITLSEDS